MNEPKIPSTPEVRIPVQETVPGLPERRVEVAVPAAEHKSEQPTAEVAVTLPVAPSAPVPLAPTKDPMVATVEGVLSAGMDQAYAAMDPATQAKFKQVGEETAVTIARMMGQAKIQVKKVVQLILAWLRIIPNVNPFYLEQEAKIKADALIAMKKNPPTITPIA